MAFYTFGTKEIDTDRLFIRKTEVPNRQLMSSGRNRDGQFGTGNTNDSLLHIPSVGLHAFISVAVDYSTTGLNTATTFAVQSNETVWLAGRDPATSSSTSTFTQIGSGTKWVSVVYREKAAFFIAENGTLWAYGDDAQAVGVFGTGQRNITLSTITQIGTLSNWKNITTYDAQVLAVKTDGSLWAWGNHGTCALGLNESGVDRSSPTRVGALNDWATVSTGSAGIGGYSAAVKTDGSLWTWGVNEKGVLGTGNTVNYSSPVRVGALNDWKDVKCAGGHVLAIKTDGSLWAWGDGGNGQLGIGTTTTGISSPVRVGALTDWSAIAANTNESMAIKTDGSLWGWGGNNSGALGTGDSTARSSPTRIGSGINWITVDVADDFSAAIRVLA